MQKWLPRFLILFCLWLSLAGLPACNKKHVGQTGKIEVLEVQNEEVVLYRVGDGPEQRKHKDQIDYAFVKKTMLEPYCIRCHTPQDPKGDIDFTVYSGTMKTISSGSPKSSPAFESIIHGEAPANGPKPNAMEIEVFRLWIKAGAPEKILD